MIKYLYVFYTVMIGIVVLAGFPTIDFLSQSWKTIAVWILIISACASFFITLFLLVAYAEEYENTESGFAEFFLRTAVGQKFLPKWPVVVWLVACAVFVQLNFIATAGVVFALTVCLGSFVFIHNGYYTRFLREQATK